MKCFYSFEDKWYEGRIGNFRGMTAIVISAHPLHEVVLHQAQVSFMSDHLIVTGYIPDKDKENIYKLESCEVAFDKRVAKRLGMK